MCWYEIWNTVDEYGSSECTARWSTSEQAIADMKNHEVCLEVMVAFI
jgi:hypothetical protein